jgi:tetratricopeptide (TPR) repeat protein
MAIRRPLLITLLAPLLAFGATLLLISLLNRSSAPPAPVSGDASTADGRSTDEQIRSLQAALARNPDQPNAEAALGNALLQKVRENGDPRNYVAAEAAFKRALDQEPRNATALAGMGTLALGRHDFRTGLAYGERARAVAPDVVRFYGIVVDAQVELGRYREGERTLQRMIDRKPNLASYARVSYLRELHGDLAGALEAMRLAVSASGGAPENVAYVQTLLGNLELNRGHTHAAERAYRLALANFPRYGPASAGLARAAVSRGDLETAIDRYRALVARLPLPEHVIALGEAELAAGRHDAAKRDFELVRIERGLYERSGVNLDLELALFEADHGSQRRAVKLARAAWSSAPSVRSADALGWALTRAGRPDAGLELAQQALRLGSRDAQFLYHAGMSARATGRANLARRYLARSLALNPRFSPLFAQRARRAMETLGGGK